jgi:hypothetical protein
VYDVLFLNHAHGQQVLARELARDDACRIARAESERRGVGRMFLAGSELGPMGDVIVIVESAPSPA